MKTDALALIDAYATAMQWAMWIWAGSALLLAGAGAWLVIAIGRLAFDHIGASFRRAHQTIAEIQQPKEEKP
ncbi:hypothetical protein ACFYO9_37595 [Streptomyces sp. NPDC005863]|uniref:hypothetical protein n=1 Tax=Streptomyces sp. NPDC005863 TaxID=3364735 RepID=UPI0036C3EE54